MIESHVAESLTDTPVVLIAGPRQAAKNQEMHYLTLDDNNSCLA
jgi:hypothetical protein